MPRPLARYLTKKSEIAETSEQHRRAKRPANAETLSALIYRRPADSLPFSLFSLFSPIHPSPRFFFLFFFSPFLYQLLLIFDKFALQPLFVCTYHRERVLLLLPRNNAELLSKVKTEVQNNIHIYIYIYIYIYIERERERERERGAEGLNGWRAINVR